MKTKLTSPRQKTRRHPKDVIAGKVHDNPERIAPTNDENDPEADVRELTLAMDQYKRDSGRMFPTWSEVLEVLTGLGYRKRA